MYFAKNAAYITFPFNYWLSFSDFYCKLLWFEITKMLIPVKNALFYRVIYYNFRQTFVLYAVMETVISKKTITYTVRDSTVVCSVMHSTVQVLTEDFCSQFRDFSSLQGKVYTSLLFITQHFHSDTLLSQLQYFTAKIKHKVRCTLYIIRPMSLQHNTSYTMFH